MLARIYIVYDVVVLVCLVGDGSHDRASVALNLSPPHETVSSHCVDILGKSW